MPCPGYPAGSRALPYLNTFRLIRGSRERGTSAITYLGFPGSLSPRQQNALAAHYAEAVSVPGARAHATGFLPGSIAQSDEIDSGLLWVELATILLIGGILGLYLRSVVAPLVTLAAAGLAYLIAIHTMSYLAARLGVHVQHEVEPIVVVLLLAVVTDYSVFFLSGMLGRLREGEAPRAAARRATAEVLPIVLTAGLIIAAGLATLWIAGIDFVRALGPAMAVVVLVSLAVSVLFVPAAMGILGRRMFWPGLRDGQPDVEPDRGRRRLDPARGGSRHEPQARRRADARRHDRGSGDRRGRAGTRPPRVDAGSRALLRRAGGHGGACCRLRASRRGSSRRRSSFSAGRGIGNRQARAEAVRPGLARAARRSPP